MNTITNADQLLKKPNINTVQYARISLEALYLNNDIFANLKYTLKQSVLGKCNRYGYVQRINSIDSYEDNEIECDDRDCGVVYNVTYNAQICIPTDGIVVVAKVDKYNKVMIHLTHGPIIIIVKSENYNKDKFYINNNDIHVVNQTQLPIASGQFLKILINGHRFSPGDNVIKALGFLQDVATDEEVKEFYSFVRMDDTGEI